MQPPTQAPATTPLQPQPVAIQPMAQPVVRHALRALDHITTVDENMEEVILREGQNGSETLSLIVGEKLFQVIRTRQSNSIVTCEHEFTMKRNSIQGFTHQRFHVLKKFRIPIIAVTGISFLLSSAVAFTPTAPYQMGMLVFLLGLSSTIFSFASPHRLSFSTTSDTHSILFFESGSHKIVTRSALSQFDQAMSTFIASGEFDVSQVTYNIGQIGDTIAQDSVITQETTVVQAPIPEPSPPVEPVQPSVASTPSAPETSLPAEPVQSPATNNPPFPKPTTPPKSAIPPVMNPPAVEPTSATPPPPVPPAPAPLPPAPIPPPSGLGASLPPPGLSMEMGGMPDEITPAPEVPMQAAPRDDTLSEGEKESILSELGDD